MRLLVLVVFVILGWFAMDARFDAIHERFDILDERFFALEAEITRLEDITR